MLLYMEGTDLFDINSLYSSTLNPDVIDMGVDIDLPEEEVEVINNNDAETIVADEIGESETSNNDPSSIEDSIVGEQVAESFDDLVVDPKVEEWSKMFVQAADMYATLKKSGDLLLSIPEPTMATDINILRKTHAVLKHKYKKVTKSSGVAEESLMALCNMFAKYFDGSGESDTFNPDLSALPDDIGLKIERDPSLKAALKNIGGQIKSDPFKIIATLALSATSLALSSNRRKTSSSSALSKALLNTSYQ